MAKLTGKARARKSKKEKNIFKHKSDMFKKGIIDKIKKYDDPILKESCVPVDFKDEETQKIVQEMKSVLEVSKNGVGLSASQIGYNKRIIVACLDKNKPEDISVFLNPSITNESEEKMHFSEGCLSYPGFYSVIERPREIEVFYETENGEEKREKYEDFACVVLCHEIDHTKGICKVGERYREFINAEIKKRMERRKRRMR